MKIRADYTFNSKRVQTAHLIWVPGGSIEALNAMLPHPKLPIFEYIQRVAKQAQWVCSVCEGALLLAQTGWLDNRNATTHWAFYKCMEAMFPKVILDKSLPRYVQSENTVTGGGISSGIDEAIFMASLIAGDKVASEITKTLQYTPDPQFKVDIKPSDSCPLSTQES